MGATWEGRAAGPCRSPGLFADRHADQKDQKDDGRFLGNSEGRLILSYFSNVLIDPTTGRAR
jgi:hypothetical protein